LVPARIQEDDQELKRLTAPYRVSRREAQPVMQPVFDIRDQWRAESLVAVEKSQDGG
jgi:hypothetical protein